MRASPSGKAPNRSSSLTEQRVRELSFLRLQSGDRFLDRGACDEPVGEDGARLADPPTQAIE